MEQSAMMKTDFSRPIPIGSRFGFLSVIGHAQHGSETWNVCVCDCGQTIEVTSFALSLIRDCCGLRLTRFSPRPTYGKHGDSHSRLYGVWNRMRQRCRNPKNPNFKDYGGRGIKVCQQWVHDYHAFKAWSMKNGYQRGLQIDRINNDGNYEPTNCRWTTPTENCRNRRPRKCKNNES